MIELAVVRSSVGIDDDECWAGDGVNRTLALRQSLHKGRFASAEVALKADQVAVVEQLAQAHANAPRLFRTTAEEFEGVSV